MLLPTTLKTEICWANHYTSLLRLLALYPSSLHRQVTFSMLPYILLLVTKHRPSNICHLPLAWVSWGVVVVRADHHHALVTWHVSSGALYWLLHCIGLFQYPTISHCSDKTTHHAYNANSPLSREVRKCFTYNFESGAVVTLRYALLSFFLVFAPVFVMFFRVSSA